MRRGITHSGGTNQLGRSARHAGRRRSGAYFGRGAGRAYSSSGQAQLILGL